ncbi:MAG: hypothetical protein IJ231_08025 [Clostridia bacterium]|nr:hypothetical protein [Clostridia bacterium]
MNETAVFQAALAEYAQAVTEVQKSRKMFDGVLGLGNHPSNAPCHDVFDKKVESLCLEAAEPENGAERAALVEAVFGAEGQWKGPEYARLMLIAAQRHTLPLLPLLAPESRKKLADWYRKTYPRRKRLPVQDQVLKALEKGV